MVIHTFSHSGARLSDRPDSLRERVELANVVRMGIPLGCREAHNCHLAHPVEFLTSLPASVRARG